MSKTLSEEALWTIWCSEVRGKEGLLNFALCIRASHCPGEQIAP